MDKIGKHFVELIPRSLSMQAKVNGDWRLKNALHMLTEVNSVNGGRRMTVSSLFELVNKTDHPLYLGNFYFFMLFFSLEIFLQVYFSSLALNPDPRHFPKHHWIEDDSIHSLKYDSAGDTDHLLLVDDDSAYVQLDSGKACHLFVGQSYSKKYLFLFFLITRVDLAR